MTSEKEGLKYSDMLRFFEIFPEVSYIYENTMNDELYKLFIHKIGGVMKDKKFPTEDVCRVFNILIRISPYLPSDKKENDIAMKFMTEMIGRIRHSIYDIPKDLFSLTLSNLLEFQQPEIANKFVFILQEVAKQGPEKLLAEFSTPKDRIRLFWSLLQIEKVCLDKQLVNPENLKFLNDINLPELDPHHFLLYKQVVCLAKMWFDQPENKDYDGVKPEDVLFFEKIYNKFSTENIGAEKREEFINEDPATKSNQAAVTEIVKILKKTKKFLEVGANLSDDIMNLVDVACGLPDSTQE